jgi:short-subunit dehydrogenase
MVSIAILGASGDLGTALMEEGNSRAANIKAYSRTPKGESVNPIQDFDSSENFDHYIITNGSFEVSPFYQSNDENLQIALEDNLISVASLIRKVLISRNKEIENGIRIDFFVIGSTSSYKGFANTAHYCAAKFALKGLLESLNEEYSNKNVRFCLFSLGTMRSRMAKKVMNQDESTFLDPTYVAKKIYDLIYSEGEGFQYEVILRRRVIR